MARQSGTFVHRRQRHALLVILVTLLTLIIPATAHAEDDNRTFFQQTNLVADQSGVAPVTDPKLVNPWGLSLSPTSPWWVSDNGTGLSTLYDGMGHPAPLGVPQSLKTLTRETTKQLDRTRPVIVYCRDYQ